MPDITMCITEDCPLKRSCYRSAASGTKPTERRQSYSAFQWRNVPLLGAVAGKGLFECDDFWPVRRSADAALPAVVSPGALS